MSVFGQDSHREELYDTLVRDVLEEVESEESVSLADLRLTSRPLAVPANS